MGARSRRPPCPALWKTPVVRWDGEVMVCCADVHGEIELGNLREHTLKELWEGDTITHYRISHVTGDFDAILTCAKCGGFTFYEMSPAEIEAWLREIGRAELIEVYRKRMGLDARD